MAGSGNGNQGARPGRVVHLATVRREPVGSEPIPQGTVAAVREGETHARYVQENLVFLRERFDEILHLLRAMPVDPEGGVRAEDWAGLHAALERIHPAFLQEEIPQAFSESIQGIARLKLILHGLRQSVRPPFEEG